MSQNGHTGDDELLCQELLWIKAAGFGVAGGTRSTTIDKHEEREPDPRFTLASERTFLAWIRTALALMAAGAGLVSLLAHLGPEQARKILGAVLISLGTLIAIATPFRFAAVDRAMRAGRPLPRPGLLSLVAFAVGIAAVVLLIFVVVD